MASFEEQSIEVRTIQAAEALSEGYPETTVVRQLGADAVNAALKSDPYLEAALLHRIRTRGETE